MHLFWYCCGVLQANSNTACTPEKEKKKKKKRVVCRRLSHTRCHLLLSFVICLSPIGWYLVLFHLLFVFCWLLPINCFLHTVCLLLSLVNCLSHTLVMFRLSHIKYLSHTVCHLLIITYLLFVTYCLSPVPSVVKKIVVSPHFLQHHEILFPSRPRNLVSRKRKGWE